VSRYPADAFGIYPVAVPAGTDYPDFLRRSAPKPSLSGLK